MAGIAERVVKRRQQLGLSQSALARRLNVKPQSIQQLEAGQVARPRYLLELARALEVDAEWLVSGQTGGMQPAAAPGQANEFALIPVYDLSASAGAGSFFDQENVLYHLAFRQQWLKAASNAPLASLAVLQASGDSMEDTIRHGDTLLVDRTQTSPRIDAIFVLRWDGQLLVKRVKADPARKKLTLLSDNARYGAVEDIRPEDLDVLGRVIWIGRQV
jgi:phage repressor protein C with HTH and peptisase S24 domain